MKGILELLGIVLLAALVFSSNGHCERRVLVQEGKKQDPVKDLPLETIYYTFQQNGVKVLRQRDVVEKYHIILKELFKSAAEMGASNVFLARCDDISEAVKVTWRAFCRSEPVEVVFPRPKYTKSDRFWLVVYLGTTESHGKWLLKSAQIKGNTVRLTYRIGREGVLLMDMHPYLAWVPLGTLEAGSYVLELFDEGEKQVTLLRRVTIPKRE